MSNTITYQKNSKIDKMSINTKQVSICGKNYKVLVSSDSNNYERKISDDAVPFNYLLSTRAGNAIRRVIFCDDDRTIVLFDNGDKVTVKRNKNDTASKRDAIMGAIVKHSFGSSVNRQLDKIILKCGITAEEMTEISKNKHRSENTEVING